MGRVVASQSDSDVVQLTNIDVWQHFGRLREDGVDEAMT